MGENEEIIVSRGFLMDLKELLEDDIEAGGPCDHEANICVCSLVSILESTKAYLNQEDSNE